LYNGRDKRKGKPAHNATLAYKVNKVRNFLNEIPKVPSHYCRKQSSRLYLPPDLSIANLYEIYSKKENSEAVNINVFRKISKEFEPPLAIFLPKKDQCAVCNEAERKITTESNENYKKHRERKENIANMKNKDKNDADILETVIYASFDLQTVLTLLYAGDTQIYFSRKLSVMNFTVYDSRKKGEIEHVVFYADTCGGQYRNQNVFAALLYAVNTVGNIKTIDIQFMESGHSYLEAHSIHATIEKYRRHRNLYVPSDYKCLIEMCRKKPFPYEVYQNRFDDIYDLQDLSTKIVTSRKKNVKGQAVKWIHLKWLRS
ncbi:Uncharacterized protein FWK35_00033164, partial [Aphis craccivora]